MARMRLVTGMSPRFAILVVLCAAEAARLDMTRILLPYRHEAASNCTLSLLETDESSCYEWESSRPDVAAVSTGGPCSQQASVSAVWGQASRQEATVMAREPRTGEAFHCAVVVDQLASLKLVGATQILLEDSPQLLQVTGQDRQGNTFTSLDGVSFDWSLQQQEPVLRFVLEWPRGPAGVKLHGQHGWAVLVQGQAVGTARLSVKPAHAAYAHVVPQQLELRVVDSVRIKPSVVFLLIGCQACFSLEQEQAAVAPGQSYSLRTEDDRVARVEGTCVWAQGLGHTRLLLADASSSINLRTADVHVVRPSYLRNCKHQSMPGLFVSPGKSWVLERQGIYQVLVLLFDEHHHQVHAGKGLQVHVHLPPEYFDVLSSTENGTLYQVRPLRTGRTVIRAELQGCQRLDGALLRATASGEQEVSIEEPLSVQPETVWLPWDPEKEPVYTLRAHAQGGSGAPVHWQLEAAPVWADVETAGTVATLVTRGGPGQVRLVAHDGHFAPASMQVSLAPIVELEALGSPVLEAELPDGELLVAVAMYGRHPNDQQLRPFDDCSQVSLAMELVDKRIIKHLPGSGGPPVRSGCTSVRLQCQAAGHTRLHLSHGLLRSTVLLGCYKRLRAVHPAKAVAVAYGALKEVAFEGGPRPWPMLPAGYQVQLSPNVADIVSVMRIVDPHRRNRDLHVFQVLCQAIGELVLKLSVGNNVSASLPSPASSTVAIRFACVTPSSVELRLSSSASNKQVVSNGGPVELELVVREAGGHRLANVSSLDVLWELSDYRLAQLDSHRDVTSHVDGSAGYRRTSKDFQVLRPLGKVGILTVTAKVRGFSAQVLRQAALPKQQVPLVSGSLQLELVDGLSATESAHQEL
ncbi:nuclear pore membrane glycoprotein 210-like isoform X2 [Dermacentor andersoni]|uniref:nuclear pore membrane glycoprotein 210-like isoform X2 n=1 Tax=Dermacentor andersoni TaxID=34620 RepID=UPI0024161DB5|nr:nuclear pore membrane glycoprotein 210-like isoform X2 [Dermacentor andersoni]